MRVTASTGVSIYLDKGRGDNIQPGDEVVLYPPASGIVNGTVQSVSRGSCRCVLLSSDARVDIGTRGEVLVPEDRFASDEATADDAKPPPRHPPWKAPPENWDQSRPLLAPAHSRSEEERGAALRGRLFANYMHTWNRSQGDDQYSLGRMGTAMWIDNPMSRGGTFQLNGEFNRRGVFLNDATDDIDGPGRLNRISYRWGGKTDKPVHVELGRFISNEFPEFGLIDGAELSYRTRGGNRIGVTTGWLPEPFPDLQTGNDFHVSTYYRFFAGMDDAFSSGIGYQKTWHKGSPDRDLLIYTADFTPTQKFSMHGSIWGDCYDSRDTLESKSFEITQAFGQAYYRCLQTIDSVNLRWLCAMSLAGIQRHHVTQPCRQGIPDELRTVSFNDCMDASNTPPRFSIDLDPIPILPVFDASAQRTSDSSTFDTKAL